jgi:hypothetical protein
LKKYLQVQKRELHLHPQSKGKFFVRNQQEKISKKNEIKFAESKKSFTFAPPIKREFFVKSSK